MRRPAVADLPAGDHGRRAQQPAGAVRERRLARPALPGQADDLAGAQREVDVVDRADIAARWSGTPTEKSSMSRTGLAAAVIAARRSPGRMPFEQRRLRDDEWVRPAQSAAAVTSAVGAGPGVGSAGRRTARARRSLRAASRLTQPGVAELVDPGVEQHERRAHQSHRQPGRDEPPPGAQLQGLLALRPVQAWCRGSSWTGRSGR